MLFEKAIRRRQIVARVQGHLEPDSDEMNSAAVMTLRPEDLLPQYIDEEKLWPQQIEMLVKWDPESINQADVWAQETVTGHPLKTCDFYNKDSSDKPEIAHMAHYKAVHLRFADQVKFIQDDFEMLVKGLKYNEWLVVLPENRIVYTKPFAYQSAGLISQVRQHLGQGQWLVTAPKTGLQRQNMVPLLCYGAYVPLGGGELEEIEQVYASLSTTGEVTIVKLYKETKLKELGINPGLGGVFKDWEYHFVDVPATRSDIAADIISHNITISIKGENESKTYQSIGYRNAGKGEQLIFIKFVPQKNQE